MLDFIYHGEVNISQDSINDFLAVGEELAIKGLADSKPGDGTDTPAKKSMFQKQNTAITIVNPFHPTSAVYSFLFRGRISGGSCISF